MPYVPFVVILALALAAHAADRYYVGPDNGHWNDPNNWAATVGGAGGAGVPATDNDIGWIQPSSSLNVTIDSAYDVNSPIRGVVVSGPASGTLSLTQSAGTMATQSSFALQSGAVYNQSGGVNAYYGSFRLDGSSNRRSSYSMSGTAQISGKGGGGGGLINSDFYQSAGLNNANGAWTLSDNSVYHLSGGTFGGDGITIQSSSQLDQQGGSYSAYSGIGITTNANYTISGGAVHTDYLEVGADDGSSAGTFTQSGGSVATSHFFVNTSGIYTLSGGEVTANFQRNMTVKGTFNQTGGIVDELFPFISGTYLLSGTGNLAAPHVAITNGGLLSQSGGAVNAITSNGIGSIDIVAGTYALSAGSLSTKDLNNSDVLSIGAKATAASETLNESSLAKLKLELDGTSAADFANILASSSAALDGNLTLLLGPDYTPQNGDSFDLIHAPSITGTFSSYTFPGLPPGLAWQITQTSTDFTATVTTPEPALSLILLLPILVRRARHKH